MSPGLVSPSRQEHFQHPMLEPVRVISQAGVWQVLSMVKVDPTSSTYLAATPSSLGSQTAWLSTNYRSSSFSGPFIIPDMQHQANLAAHLPSEELKEPDQYL